MTAWKNSLVGLFASVIALSLVACVGEAPETKDGGNCDNPGDNLSCLMIQIGIAKHAHKASSGDLKGKLCWAIYNQDEVMLFGPGDNTPEYEADRYDVSFEDPDHIETVYVEAMIPGNYHALAAFDEFGDDCNEAKIVTYPKDDFRVPPGRRTVIEVNLDYNR